MRHLKECSDLILVHERATGGHYGLVLKVRDNTVAVRQVSIRRLSIQHVHTKACCEWGGINDKTMVMHRRFLEKTLGAYYDIFTSMMWGTSPSGIHLRNLTYARNNEQVQAEILEYMGVPVLRHSYGVGQDAEDILPFVDGRCVTHDDNTDHWCTVWVDKDCWPQQDWAVDKACHFLPGGSEINWTSPAERKAIIRQAWSDSE